MFICVVTGAQTMITNRIECCINPKIERIIGMIMIVKNSFFNLFQTDAFRTMRNAWEVITDQILIETDCFKDMR